MARIRQLIAAASNRLVLSLSLCFYAFLGVGLGIAPATAQVQTFADQGSAFSACSKAAAAAVKATSPDYRRPASPPCVWLEFDPRYDCQYLARESPASAWFVATCGQYRYPSGKTCESRPDWNGPYPYLSGGAPKNGSVTCNDGCKQAWYSTGDGYFNGKYSSVPGTCSNYDDDQCKAQFGTGYYWNQGMSACEPEQPKCGDGIKANSLGKCEPEPCPDGMAQNPDGTCKKKDNECPAGQVKSPDGRCLPGEGQCAAGEVRGPDGTCKKDGDGDGDPDEPGPDDKESFSGGDDCNSPPSCSGSPILCGQARIQWRIECNTRRNRNIAGGACSTAPVCTGDKCDALEYSALLMQWRTACAVEKLAARGSDNGGSEGQPEWTKVGGMSTDPGAGASPDDTKVLTTKVISMNDLDQSGIGGGGSCPGFMSGGGGGGQGVISGLISTLSSPPAFFCEYMGQLKALIIIIAAVSCAFILSRGTT